MTDKELIIACKIGHRNANKLLYNKYAAKMLGVCRRYISDYNEAEDIFMEGMYKVFTHLSSFEEKGSLEGWMRKIMVNECLMYLRKKHSFQTEALPVIESEDLIVRSDVYEQIAADEIIALLNELPNGYRTIFNLYVIEGYKHEEIADILNISINTSKTQLMMAKKKLQVLIEKRLNIKIETLSR